VEQPRARAVYLHLPGASTPASDTITADNVAFVVTPGSQAAFTASLSVEGRRFVWVEGRFVTSSTASILRVADSSDLTLQNVRIVGNVDCPEPKCADALIAVSNSRALRLRGIDAAPRFSLGVADMVHWQNTHDSQLSDIAAWTGRSRRPSSETPSASSKTSSATPFATCSQRRTSTRSVDRPHTRV